MLRKFLSAWIALSSSFAFAAAVQSSRITLALNWKAEPEFGGFYAAQAGGEFTRRNLDVKIVEGGAGTPVVQMIASGKADYGIVEADEIILSQEHGSDVTALFAVYQTSPMGIMSRASRGFKSIKDVVDSPGTLAIQTGSNYALFLKQKFGTPKVKLVPYFGGIGNFLEDPTFSQQCFVTSEPLAAKKKGVEARAFLFADEGFNPYVTVLVARAERLKKHPDETKAIVESVRAGWLSYLKDPTLANHVMEKLNTAMDAQTFSDIAAAQKPLIYGVSNLSDAKPDSVGKMTEERWKKLTEQLIQLKVIRGTVPASRLFRTL